MSQNDNAIIAQYEEKISKAIDALGAAAPGNVWLYRVEHLKDVPPEELDTSKYTEAQKETLKDAVGRWFGDDLGIRFQHMYHYVNQESHDGVENIRLSAVQVPLDAANACYLGRVPKPDHGNWSEMSSLQRARSTTSNEKDEYFFPKKLQASDLPGTGKATIDRARDCNAVLDSLEKNKQPLCEIALNDYLSASPEAWYEMGLRLDHMHETDKTRNSVAFYVPPSKERPGIAG